MTENEISKIMVDAMGSVLAVLLLWELGRTLPLQNILVITAFIVVGEGALEWLLAGKLWGVPLWLAVVLAARKLAQIILRPWRTNGHYGIWLIGLASTATAAWQFSVKAAALRFATTAVVLVALVPWFIQKRPVTTSAAATK